MSTSSDEYDTAIQKLEHTMAASWRCDEVEVCKPHGLPADRARMQRDELQGWGLTIAEFVVPGTPVAQPRHRVAAYIANDGKARGRAYGADARHPIHEWRDAITRFARPHAPETPWPGPIGLAIEYRFLAGPGRVKCPKTNPHLECEWHLAKPDEDNARKPIQDTLRECGFYVDDSQVCMPVAVKRWVLPCGTTEIERPGVTILVVVLR